MSQCVGPKVRYIERRFRKADEKASRVVGRLKDLMQRDPEAASRLLDDPEAMAALAMGREIDDILRLEDRYKSLARRIPAGRARRVTLRESEDSLKADKRDTVRRYNEARP